MQVKSLDGHYHNWQLTGHTAYATMGHKSTFHLCARQLLKTLYPTLQILEEISIPIKKSETYFLDFYIPLLKKGIEVHGEQHYSFVAFYHTTQLNFFKAQRRDREKREWCELNSIEYIELPYNEKENQWVERIKNDNNTNTIHNIGTGQTLG